MMAPMWCMGLFGFLVLVLIIAGIVLVTRSVTGSSGSRQSDPPHDSDTSIRILQERYARGEIDEREYQERRRILESRDSDTPEA